MLTSLSIGQLALAQSRTTADGLLLTAKTELQLDAVATDQDAQQQVIDKLRSAARSDTAAAHHVDKTA